VECLVGTERGDRGKEGVFGLTRKLWNIFPDTQFLSNILEFTQHLISSIIDLLRRKLMAHHKQQSANCKCLQTFKKKAVQNPVNSGQFSVQKHSDRDHGDNWNL
jgi:hypothetical protein